MPSVSSIWNGPGAGLNHFRASRSRMTAKRRSVSESNLGTFQHPSRLTSDDHAGYLLEAAGLAALGIDPAREDALMKTFGSMPEKVLTHLAPWLESIGVMVDGADGCKNIPLL